jgi:hypothetical protein
MSREMNLDRHNYPQMLHICWQLNTVRVLGLAFGPASLYPPPPPHLPLGFDAAAKRSGA